MKKFLLSVITVIAVGTLVSCNNGDVENKPTDDRKEVTFWSNIVKETSPAATRAAGNKWAENDAIGVFMLESSSTDVVENMSNVRYTAKNEGETGNFEPDGTSIYFPDNGNEVRFMSYYPHTTELSGNTYKVNVSEQATQSSIDLLYSFNTTAKYNKGTIDKKVKLTFDHKLTKIRINVKAGDGLEGEDLDNIAVSFENFSTTADFNLITGSLDNYYNIASITPASISPVDGYRLSYEAIVLPIDDPRGATIKFDLNNGDEEVSSDVFTWNFDEKELKNGNEYIYNVTVKRSGIVVEAEINNWDEGGEENIDAE